MNKNNKVFIIIIYALMITMTFSTVCYADTNVEKKNI